MQKKTLVNVVAIYMRLSKDDGDREESESISNQRKIIREFIEENFVYNEIVEYIDDGYSGSNFQRPAFRNLLLDVQRKKINLVITKNLARFGRSYLECGGYIEKIFPDNKVRYIAILDNVDNYEDNISNDFAPIKGVFNEMYCRETSKAVKKSKREKMIEGYYSCNTAPFGYKKSEEDKGKLVIDDYASKIVIKIFKMKENGKTTNEIAEYLNKNKIPTPSVYLKIKGLEQLKDKNIWKRSAVNRILANPVYLGHCVRGKTQNINYKSKKRINIRREDCIITPNTHEAIISEEIFYKVHNTKKYGCIKGESNINILLDNLLYCNICNRKLGKRKLREYVKIKCNYNFESCLLCSNNMNIDYQYLEKIVIDKIIQYYEEHLNLNKLRDKLLKRYNKIQIKELELSKENLKNDQNKINFKISRIYNERLTENIDEEEYINKYKELSNLRKEISEKISRVENDINILKSKEIYENKKSLINKEIKKIKNGTYTKEDISLLINKVKVDSENIIIEFKFTKMI